MDGTWQNVSLRRFFSIGDYEQDPGFSSLLADSARRGILIAGLLGIFAVLWFTAGHLLLFQKAIVWSYVDKHPWNEIVLIDKLFIIVLALIGVGISRTALGLNQARWFVGALVWFIIMAILFDDLLTGDVSFTPAYLVLVLVLAVASVPFKAYQALALALFTSASFFALTAYLPVVTGLPPVRLFVGHSVFLILFAVLLTGISSFMYNSRFEQYAGRRRVEQLKEALEDRARALETEKAKTEEQAAQLRELERAKEQFFANVSHELRTPLTLILGPITDARHRSQYDGGGLSAGDLDMIYRNGLRLQHQINQLLDLSKVGSEEFILHVHRTDMAQFVREIAESFMPIASRRAISLDVDSAEEGCEVFINTDLTEKVVLNLLSNAIKFTPAGGTIRVSLRNASHEGQEVVQLVVRDTGIGIAPDDLTHIFDRFHQTSLPGPRLFGSTGIGLALSKEIVELQGGRIEAESEPDFGSRFTVTLKKGRAHFEPDIVVDDDPLLDISAYADLLRERRVSYINTSLTDPSSVDQDEPHGDRADADAPLVLIVEDHADVRRYLRQHLIRNYRVAQAANGREGLEMVHELKPALVLCDIMMPEMDGLELCRSIKTNPDTNHIPVVILTARADDESRLEGLGTMADDFMAKPFNAAELTMRVENLIELRRMLRARYTETVDISATKISVSSYEARFLEQVRTVIERHLSNSNFGVDWLADEVAISPRQLQRRLRASLRLSAAGYIRMIRLQRAAQLLEQGAGTVSEVANQVGFQDATHFSRLFRQAYGVIPSEYRREGSGKSVGV